ncbi:hypothetical protein [Shewanella surugensis]|uniref:Alpha/beta hydrolase n=1 Tax=Shewanella surugensis TaxID=212020 RepID=A0ABT0LH12_9GAMM|nr:hypothetical protein [Shewanella surugensis]MCL1126986.1 hypothetical protein [Shewanella surugensis]
MGGMMAMRARAFGLKAERYVLLGAPSAPLPIMNIMQNILKMSPEAIAICQDKIAKQIGLTWEQQLQGKIYASTEDPLLLVYDNQDKEVPLFHAEKIQQIWENSILIQTTGLGHRKLIWDPNVIQSVISFITAPPDQTENQLKQEQYQRRGPIEHMKRLLRYTSLQTPSPFNVEKWISI